MKIKTHCLILLFLGLSFSVFSQTSVMDALKTLEQINNSYRQADDYILDLTFKMNNTNSGEQIDKIPALYKKKGDNIYYKLGGIETGYQEKMNIALKTFDSTIVLTKGALFHPINLGDIQQNILDAIVTKAEVKQISSAKTEIILDVSESDIKKVIVSYNPQTMLLNEVQSFYRRPYKSGGSSVPVKITVTYNKFIKNAGLKKDDFMLAKYFVVVNGSYKLKPVYSKFKFYNTVPKPGSL
ncbi:MAG: hypothetical protein POELPBGB_03617 [Bacteroidia bacterium]|nr:hypothetical protein [Bacteroidia bacterium]